MGRASATVYQPLSSLMNWRRQHGASHAVQSGKGPDVTSRSPMTDSLQVMVETLPFVDLVRTFVYDRFALDPVAATVAGVHQHDHELGDVSADGWAKRRAFSEEWLARFEQLDPGTLSAAQAVDRELLLAELRGERALAPFE